MNTEEKKSKIRNYLETFIQDDDFENNDNIIEMGLLNSLMTMQLVLFLEKEFGVKFNPKDLNVQNFQSINSMVALVEQ